MSRVVYEIRVAGAVPSSVLDDFTGVTIISDVAGCTLQADMVDEAEFHGLLDALRRESCILLDVRRETQDSLSSAFEERPDS